MHRMRKYNCVILGDTLTGKTSFINRHVIANFYDEEVSTPGVKVHTLTFVTNRGLLHFTVWDPCEHQSVETLPDGMFTNAHCAILMFDVTSRTTYLNVEKWRAKVLSMCPHIPIVVCGNKADKYKFRKINPRTVLYHRIVYTDYTEVAALCNFNFEKPFMCLAKRLTGDPTMKLVALPTMPAPVLPMTDETRHQVEHDLMEAHIMPEPPEQYSETDTEFDNEDLIDNFTDNEDDF